MYIRIFTASCIFFLAACHALSTNESFVMQNAKQMNHPNGLNVKIPENYSARQTENGFVVEPANNENQNLRHPILIYVTLTGDDALKGKSDVKTKSLESKTVSYLTEKSEGGSGGETYSLRVGEKTFGGFIEYAQATQSEYSEPDFKILWAIVENTSLKK